MQTSPQYELQSMKQMLLLLSILVWVAAGYDTTAIVCALIPYTPYFNQNLSYLWGSAMLQNADRYGFLIISPILIVVEIVTLVFYNRNPKIMGKAGFVFAVVICFEILLNLHYFVSAVYYTLADGIIIMPSSFPNFCSINSVISAFFEFMHLIFILIIPLYIVYILRSSLKKNSKVWNLIYVGIFILSVMGTYLMWYFGFLGLNIFGLCGVTFIRFPDANIGIPIANICYILVFLAAGIFTIQYCKKHIPNSIGFRKNKKLSEQTLLMYVIGYAGFGLLQAGIMLELYLNCKQTNPAQDLFPLITVYNYLRLIQCLYIYFIIFRGENARKAFKKFLKKMFAKNNAQNKMNIKQSMSNSESNNPRDDEIFNFEEVLLQIQQENNNIDILKISQVITIVSGIYIAYKQYYNIKEEYFNPIMFTIQPHQSKASLSFPRKYLSFNNTTKNIYYHEKMSVKINIEIVKDFIHDLSLLPKLGILQCTMIIHSPKIFQHLLENDNLQAIFESFQLHQNTRKMFDLAQGQGGRSGEFFFYSADNKFVLKTITPDEFEFLDSNLIYFHQHFNRNPDSVLAKIYGLFTFKGDEMQRTYHLILMKNMLGCHNSQIRRTYDLKGSRYDREVNKKGNESNQLQKMTLKDIDFMKEEGRIHVSKENKVKLQEIIVKDTLFLKNLNLVDYSLLIIKVRWNQPPKNPQFWGRYQRLPSFVTKNEYYHIGIIDYLQQWDLQKKGQKWWKILMGKKDISAQQPKFYQHRFSTFVGEITQEFCLRKQITINDEPSNLQNSYQFNKFKFQQNLLKLKKLENQGQYITKKIKYLTEGNRSNSERQDGLQERVEIQMSLSNKISSERSRERQQAIHNNNSVVSCYPEYESHRSKTGSPLQKDKAIIRKDDENNHSYPQSNP